MYQLQVRLCKLQDWVKEKGLRVLILFEGRDVAGKGGTHWRALRGSLAFAAARGINRRRLHGVGELTKGTYRLTLVAAGGSSRSLEVHVR